MNKIYTVKGSNKVRTYQMTLPLYGTPYIVYIGPTLHDAGKGLEIEFGIESDTIGSAALAKQIYHKDYGNMHIMLLDANTTSLPINSIIAHESTHLSWWILEHVGVEIDANNHEAQAYVLENIFTNVCKAVEEYNKFYKPKTKKK